MCTEDELEPRNLSITTSHSGSRKTGELGRTLRRQRQRLKAPERRHGFFAPGSPVVVGLGQRRAAAGRTTSSIQRGSDERPSTNFPQRRPGQPTQHRALPEPGWSRRRLQRNRGTKRRHRRLPWRSRPTARRSTASRRSRTKKSKAPRTTCIGDLRALRGNLEPIGWTGGQQRRRHGQCVLEPGIYEGEHIQIAAGKEGDDLRARARIPARTPVREASRRKTRSSSSAKAAKAVRRHATEENAVRSRRQEVQRGPIRTAGSRHALDLRQAGRRAVGHMEDRKRNDQRTVVTEEQTTTSTRAEAGIHLHSGRQVQDHRGRSRPTTSTRRR